MGSVLLSHLSTGMKAWSSLCGVPISQKCNCEWRKTWIRSRTIIGFYPKTLEKVLWVPPKSRNYFCLIVFQLDLMACWHETLCFRRELVQDLSFLRGLHSDVGVKKHQWRVSGKPRIWVILADICIIFFLHSNYLKNKKRKKKNKG